MAGSDFDEAFEDADDELFAEFGEQGGARYRAKEGGPSYGVQAVLLRNVLPVGGGTFVAVELAADLRIRQVPQPQKGDQLQIGACSYCLNDWIGTDGLINRFSLMEV